MLDYLKSELNKRAEQQNPVVQTEVDSDAILEYTSMFQELDDLSQDGTSLSERKPFEIPVEDDIELETIQINYSDGRVVDVPGDATVTESYEELSHRYNTMKKREDFVQEAYSSVERLPRESDERYQNRVNEYISSHWNAYQEYVKQEGLFGQTTRALNESCVPDKITLEFSNTYKMTTPLLWEIDRNKNITKKQLDTATLWSNMRDQMHVITESMMEVLSNRARKEIKFFDDAYPRSVIIPKGNVDQYTMIVEFDVPFSKENQFVAISIPVNSDMIQEGMIEKSATVELLPTGLSFNAVRKRDYELIVEQASRPSRFGRNRFYQEAIDFGGGGDPPAPVENTEPNTQNDSGDATVDANVEGPSVDPNADGADDTTTTPDVSIPANVNDVSDQIAQNVSDQTKNDTPDDLDINVDLGDAGDGGSDEPVDMNVDLDNEENPIDTNSVDAELDALDDAGATDMDDAGLGSVENLDDMTIDELIAQGSEKLKGMTIGQLKEFLNSPDGTSPQDVQEAFFTMEALFTRNKNVKKRIETALHDVEKGLTKIIRGIEEEDWDRREFTKYWHVVKNGATLSGGMDDDGDLYVGTSQSKAGEYFSERVDQLMHYLKIAIKKRRAREAFTDAEKRTLNQFYEKLQSLYKKGNTIASSIRSNDIGLDDVCNAAKTVMEQVPEIKPLLSDKKFTESYVFEAAIITKKNVKAQIQEHMQSALGILNNTDITFRTLVEEFKEEGKALNKALTKASKMKKLFSESQIVELEKLNGILMDLQGSMRINGMNESYTNGVKKLIAEFAKQCKVVNGVLNSSSVQEACCQEPDAVQELQMNTRKAQDEYVGKPVGTIDAKNAKISSSARERALASIAADRRGYAVSDDEVPDRIRQRVNSKGKFNPDTLAYEEEAELKRISPSEVPDEIRYKPVKNRDGSITRRIPEDEVPEDINPRKKLMLTVGEEDEMSYSSNNSPDDATNEPVDGADVGGVDFESEGVQREERVRKAKARDAVKKQTGYDKATAKQISDDIETVQARGLKLGTGQMLADQKKARDVAISRLGDKLLDEEIDGVIDAHDSAATPKYMHKMKDSISRGRDSSNKLWGARESIPKSAPNARELRHELADSAWEIDKSRFKTGDALHRATTSRRATDEIKEEK